jgi:hypothetical protein
MYLWPPSRSGPIKDALHGEARNAFRSQCELAKGKAQYKSGGSGAERKCVPQ